MFVLGHVGLTMTAARAAGRGVDLRLAALLSILPDLVDKPAFLAFPEIYSGNTRGAAHTFAAAAAVGGGLWLWRRRRDEALLLAACYAAHMLLDLGWTSNHPAILFWPFLGPLPPPSPASYTRAVVHYNAAGELLGLFLLLRLAWAGRWRDPDALLRFLKTGRL